MWRAIGCALEGYSVCGTLMPTRAGRVDDWGILEFDRQVRQTICVWHRRPGIHHVCRRPAPPPTRCDLPSLSDRRCVRVSQGGLRFLSRCFPGGSFLLALLLSSRVLTIV